jgi:nucleotide-binding universal stress UspA family protein
VYPGLVSAALIGVNIGPNLTYVGSLATLLRRRGLVDSTVTSAAPTLREFVTLCALTVPLCFVVAVLRCRCASLSLCFVVAVPRCRSTDAVVGLDARSRMVGMSAPRAVIWITEGTWAATVDAAAVLAPAERFDRVLLHVMDTGITEALHGAFGGLLGRGDRHRDQTDPVTNLAAIESARLLDAAQRRLGGTARRESRSGRVEREVVAACEGATLLVCARDGDRSRLGPHSLGPHTRFVVDHAPCAVLLSWPGQIPSLGSIPPPPPGH